MCLAGLSGAADPTLDHAKSHVSDIESNLQAEQRDINLLKDDLKRLEGSLASCKKESDSRVKECHAQVEGLKTGLMVRPGPGSQEGMPCKEPKTLRYHSLKLFKLQLD